MSDLSSRTNNLLFHAHNLLKLLESEQADSSISSSLEVAVRSVLRDGWVAWLEELSNLAGKQNDVIDSIYAFDRAPLHNLPDMQHLINLKQQPNTWLSKLLERVDPSKQELAVRSVAPNRSAPVGIDSISLISLDDPEGADEVEALTSIISEFKRYVNQIRSQHVEW